LLVFDGFDHYAAQADLQARTGALTWSDIENTQLRMDPGRGGFGQCVTMSADSDVLSIFGGSFNQNLTAGTVGIALQFFPRGFLWADLQIVDYVAGVVRLTVRLNLLSGAVLVYEGDPDTGGSTLLAVSPPNAFSPYVWAYIELSAALSASSIGFEAHVNGTTAIANIAGVLPVYTPPSGAAPQTPVFNGFRVRLGSATFDGPGWMLDDFYVCDHTAGPGTYACNGFLGDVSVRTLRTTGNSSVQWTPLAATNWQEVGEVGFDGDLSYNYATTIGSQDLFTFQSLPTTTATVFGVQVTGAYRKLDASSQSIAQNVVSGGTAASSTIQGLSLSYAYYTSLFVLDPHTNATWTAAAVDALTAGYTLNS
jgi:hypothetical protein